MNSDPKIIDLDSSAAYLCSRAHRMREADKPLEALDLLRMAIARDPSGHACRLDIADLYMSLGDMLQSLRYLLELLADHEDSPKVYYLLMHCLSAMGCSEDARLMHIEYVSRKENPDLVDMMLMTQPSPEAVIAAVYARKDQRSERFSLMATRQIEQNDHPAAIRLLKESVRRNPDNVHAWAMLAAETAAQGDSKTALQAVHRALNGKCPCQTLCICAEALHRLSMDDQAVQTLLRAEKESEPDDIRAVHMLAETYGSVGLHEEAHRLALKGLKRLPYDPLFLHLAAVSGKLSGQTDAEVLPYWHTITRIDPDDPVAAFYYETASKDGLDACELSYGFDMPKSHIVQIAESFHAALAQGAADAWADDPAHKHDLTWMALQAEESLARPAISLLITREDERSVALIRYLLLRPETSFAVRRHMLRLIRDLGLPKERFMPYPFHHAYLPEAKRLYRRFTVPERKCVTDAVKTLERTKKLHLYTQIVFLWDAYMNSRPVTADLLCDNPATAAALAYGAMKAAGLNPDMVELAILFQCGRRKLAYYIRCLETAVPAFQKGIQP